MIIDIERTKRIAENFKLIDKNYCRIRRHYCKDTYLVIENQRIIDSGEDKLKLFDNYQDKEVLITSLNEFNENGGRKTTSQPYKGEDFVIIE